MSKITLEDLQRLIVRGGGNVEMKVENYDFAYQGVANSVAGYVHYTATIKNLPYLVDQLNKYFDVRSESVEPDPVLSDLIEEVFNG